MLSLQRVSVSYDEKLVLDNVDLAVNAGEIVALIGENGAGKTTLLRAILGEIKLTDGAVHLHSETVGYVPQYIATNNTVQEYFAGLDELWRVKYAMETVGLGGLRLNTHIKVLSGGQKTRLALAKVLASPVAPTVLLFDEPTNNLDADGLAWLEDFIQAFTGSVLLVSHDRAFINSVATKVIELDSGTLKQYGGNYDFYKQQKAIERQSEQTEYEKYTGEKKRLAKLKQAKANQMQHASSDKFNKVKHESKMAFNGSRSQTQKNIGQKLKALDSRINQLKTIDRPKSVKQYRASLDGAARDGKLLLKLENICKAYDGTSIVGNFNVEIRGGERVRIAGDNGSGKTTILKIAASLLTPDSGGVKLGESIKIGYFSQDVDGLDYGRTGVANLQMTGSDDTSIFSSARSLGLTKSDLRKTPAALSRGQQAKLGFTKLLLDENQLLILDEPTNHLDIASRESIESALQQYGGAVLVASHDEYFLQQIGIDRTLDL